MPEPSAIDVKTAVRIAMNYLEQFHEFILARGVRLEETEYDDSGSWLITLSTFEDPDSTLANFANFASPKRTYKIFRIDSRTGEVKSMKVRSLQPVE